MDSHVMSFDLHDDARLEMSASRGGFPRLTVSTVDETQEVEFVHTVDSDPAVSIKFFSSLSEYAQHVVADLRHLVPTPPRQPDTDSDVEVYDDERC